MKRDMDLIRDLVLKLEALDLSAAATAFLDPWGPELLVDGFTPDQVFYHLRLLDNAGFIDHHSDHGIQHFAFSGLTWHGHDFADSVRDSAVWHATKEEAKKAGGFSVDLLVALAKGFLKKKIEEHTGVSLDL